MASMYMKLAQLYHTTLENKKDVAGAVQEYLTKNVDAFQKVHHHSHLWLVRLIICVFLFRTRTWDSSSES